ncbi:integrase [Gossypium australe]|uniref:Integrase n=1 Tax=Gossypium australe TaxID=47621 RepID=A0A5B6X4I1_9ROSI|nr:integrase [Gossypium australe]
MARTKKRGDRLCGKVLGMPASKSGTSIFLGLLQPNKFSKWKWERITMGFVSGLPLTPTKKNSIWVIVPLHLSSNRLFLTKASKIVHRGDCQTTWCTGFNYIRSRPSFHFEHSTQKPMDNLKELSKSWSKC